jgi:hypothetical protein
MHEEAANRHYLQEKSKKQRSENSEKAQKFKDHHNASRPWNERGAKSLFDLFRDE